MANNNYKEIEDNEIETNNKKRISNGRRKIPIETILDPTKKHVTFSKRRQGIFKKASELSALCGVEMAILTFSEKGKLFSYGHPTSHDVIHRYLNCGSCCQEEQVDEYDSNVMDKEHSKLREEIEKKIDEKKRFADHYDVEKKRLAIETDKQVKEGCRFWWEDVDVKDMELDEVEEFYACLMELRHNVVKKTETKYNSSNDLSIVTSSSSNHTRNTNLLDKVTNYDHLMLGMVSNSKENMEVGDGDSNMVNDVNQSFEFKFMDEVHKTNRVFLEDGRDDKHMSDLSPKMGVYNIDLMNQYPALASMKDHIATLASPGSVKFEDKHF